MITFGRVLLIAGLVAGLAGAACAEPVAAPRDAATGMATGKRMHKPVLISKEWAPIVGQHRLRRPARRPRHGRWQVGLHRAGRQRRRRPGRLRQGHGRRRGL